MKYRIKEKNGTYTVQVRGYEYKGILWWRKKVWNWYACDCFGHVWNLQPPLFIPLAPTFNNIDSAKEWVRGVLEEPKYHCV